MIHNHLLMEFTTRQLELFRAVARSGSFTRAAEQVVVSQPAVSAQVRELERALGVQLLERDRRRGPRPTPEGERVLSHVERILAALEDLSREAAELREGQAGRLVVGASTTVGEYLLPEVIGRYRSAHPGVELRAEIANTARVVERVRSGEIDLAFVGEEVDDPALETLPFAQDEIVAVASAKHPLAARRSVRPADLAEADLIAREAGSATRRTAETCLGRLGVRPRVVMELGSNEAVKQVVLRGLGVGLLSRRAVAAEVRGRRLRVLRIAGFRCIRTLSVVHRRGKALTRAEEAFLAMVLPRGKRSSAG